MQTDPSTPPVSTRTEADVVSTEKEFLAHLARVAPKTRPREAVPQPTPKEESRRGWLASVGTWVAAGLGAVTCGLFAKLFKRRPGQPRWSWFGRPGPAAGRIIYAQQKQWREDEQRRERELQDRLQRGIRLPNP